MGRFTSGKREVQKEMSKIIFTNGCFDILTPAHINLLSTCRVLAGIDGQVYVAIDSDAKVRKDKGPMRPVNTFVQRVESIKALQYPAEFKYPKLRNMVECIFPFDTNEELRYIIEHYKVNTIVKGSDWEGNVVGSDVHGVNVVLIDRDERFSTTKIIDRVLETMK